MKYIAKKPVRFDKFYAVGEEIPDGVVDPGRAKALIAMGLIWPQEAAGAAEEVGGVDTPTTAAEPKDGAPEPAQKAKSAARKKTVKK